ncbi:MAG: hypothetical protein QXN59_00955 [Candidatus Micrarchaeaceae archaeon]
MAFNGLLSKAIEAGTPQTGLVLSYKPRFHISSKRAEEFGMSYSLEKGDFVIMRNRNGIIEYSNAKNLTYDMLLSVYDFNSGMTAIARFEVFGQSILSQFNTFIKSLKKPNLEARIIGLQSTSPTTEVRKSLDMINRFGISLNEVDLFGENMRHISIESKRGMSMDLLLLNRVYRPGELKNTQTYEQFKRGELPETVQPKAMPQPNVEKPVVEPSQKIDKPPVVQPSQS